MDRNRRMLMLGGMVLVATPALPRIASAAVGTNVSRKLNIAGRQRMLSQRIAMAASMARLGVGAEGNLKLLLESGGAFSKAQSALRVGSDDFGLIEESHPAVLRALDRVDLTWSELALAINAVSIDGGVSRSNFRAIAEVNLKLLSRANIVVKKMVSAYSEDDRAALGVAQAIDMAGRQRMLSQKMIKEAALIGLKYKKSENREFLTETLDTFDSSLFALTFGDEDIGIPPAPDNVLPTLQNVEALWLDVYPLLDEIASLGRADSFELEELSDSAAELLKLSNDAVLAYEDSWQV